MAQATTEHHQGQAPLALGAFPANPPLTGAEIARAVAMAHLILDVPHHTERDWHHWLDDLLPEMVTDALRQPP